MYLYIYVSIYLCIRTLLLPEAPDACAHTRAVVLIPAHLCVYIEGFFELKDLGSLEAYHTYARYVRVKP